MKRAVAKPGTGANRPVILRHQWLTWAFWALLAAAAHGATLQGLIIDAATSSPLAGATISYGGLANPKEHFREDVDHFKDSPLLVFRNSIRSGEDGTFSLDEDPQHPAVLLVRADEHAWRGVAPSDRKALADPTQSGRLRVPLMTGATLSGIVAATTTTTTAGQPHLELRLLASPEASFVQVFPVATVGPGGAYRWDHLPAGHYEVGLFEVAGGRGYITLARKADLANGDRKEVDLGTGLGECSLRGQILSASHNEPVVGAEVTIRPQFDWDYSLFATLTDKDGHYRIGRLRPGQYGIDVHERNMTGRIVPNAAVLVTVEGDTEHDIKSVSEGLP